MEPNDYGEWENLISAMVDHYKERGSGIRYWEVANEPDIGEDGGCPYRFKPDSYARYYQHTAAAVLRADPGARVGGPALANGSRRFFLLCWNSARQERRRSISSHGTFTRIAQQQCAEP